MACLLQKKCREPHRYLYIAFVNLAKAFNTVNQDMLWCSLAKGGCPPKFIVIIKDFHINMCTHIVSACIISDAFNVNIGVKQGCVLMPTLFSIYLAAVILLNHQSLQLYDGTCLHYRLGGSVFNLYWLYTFTMTSTRKFFDLQYADNAADPGLQEMMLSNPILMSCTEPITVLVL